MREMSQAFSEGTCQCDKKKKRFNNKNYAYGYLSNRRESLSVLKSSRRFPPSFIEYHNDNAVYIAFMVLKVVCKVHA